MMFIWRELGSTSAHGSETQSKCHVLKKVSMSRQAFRCLNVLASRRSGTSSPMAFPSRAGMMMRPTRSSSTCYPSWKVLWTWRMFAPPSWPPTSFISSLRTRPLTPPTTDQESAPSVLSCRTKRKVPLACSCMLAASALPGVQTMTGCDRYRCSQPSQSG